MSLFKTPSTKTELIMDKPKIPPVNRTITK
jgi:hypothetical protein